MADALVQKMITRLFPHEEKQLTVVRNRDGFLSRTDVQEALQYARVNVFHGQSLDLRVVAETELDDTGRRILFIQDDDFEVMPDIVRKAEIVSFQAKNMFQHYHWDTIKGRDYNTLKWLAAQKQIVYLTPEQTSMAVHEYGCSQARVDDEMLTLLKDWSKLARSINYHRPQKWASSLADIMLRAIELDRWHEMIEPITELNQAFQEFLKESYINVSTSTLGHQCPRVVKQILPFIASHNTSRSALIVVDGMNLWQAKLLCNHIEGNINNIDVKFEASYSWLPSTTELSRQAIFKGDYPSDSYVQNPSTEKNLWHDFWSTKHVPPVDAFYQYSGDIESPQQHLKYLAYVTLDLDKMMHAASNYMYLYDDTKRWVEDNLLLGIVQRLLAAGFTVYITTDHGNIEPGSNVALAAHYKAGANWSGRHITLHESASKQIFTNEYTGRVTQVDASGRTFYPTDRDIFSREAHVTHGGSHWLEVIIPFITISKL